MCSAHMVQAMLLALLMFATVASAAVVTIRVDADRESVGAMVVQVKGWVGQATYHTFASVGPGASDTLSLADGSYDLWSDNGPASSESMPVPVNVTIIDSMGICIMYKELSISSSQPMRHPPDAPAFTIDQSNPLPSGPLDNGCSRWQADQAAGDQGTEPDWQAVLETPTASTSLRVWLIVALLVLVFMLVLLAKVNRARRHHHERHLALEQHFAQMVHNAPQVAHTMFSRILRAMEDKDRWLRDESSGGGVVFYQLHTESSEKFGSDEGDDTDWDAQQQKAEATLAQLAAACVDDFRQAGRPDPYSTLVTTADVGASANLADPDMLAAGVRDCLEVGDVARLGATVRKVLTQRMDASHRNELELTTEGFDAEIFDARNFGPKYSAHVSKASKSQSAVLRRAKFEVATRKFVDRANWKHKFELAHYLEHFSEKQQEQRKALLQLEWLNAEFSGAERADLLHVWESTEDMVAHEAHGSFFSSKMRINTSDTNSVAHVVAAAKKLGVMFEPPVHETGAGFFAGLFTHAEPEDPEGEWVAMLEAHGIHDLQLQRGGSTNLAIEEIDEWDLTDFVHVMSIVMPGRRTRKALDDLFDVFDKDMNGKISLLDLKQEMEKLHPSRHKELQDDQSTQDAQHLYKVKKVLDEENDINLVEVDVLKLLRIFPGNVDTDGDGVIDEQEMRIKYLNRELFIETVMNDGDRVHDDGRLVCTFDTNEDLGMEVANGGAVTSVQPGGQADRNLVTVDFHVESIDDRPVTAEEDASTIRRLLQPLGGSKVCVVFVQPNLASDVGRADGADDELLLAP